MAFRFVFGFLALSGVSALQKAANGAGSCGDSDCGIELPSSIADKPFAADVDAWVMMCHMTQNLDWNMYTPMLETVKEGVESHGGKAQIIGLSDVDPMLNAVGASVAAGRRPLVFAIAYWHAASDPAGIEVLYGKLKLASAVGAYLVLYQSEPAIDLGKYGYPKHIYHAMDSVNKTGAHEMWEYSRANVAHYPPRDDLIVRFVPPGYVPKLDVGVDMNSPLKAASSLGYLGTPAKPCHPAYMQQLGDRLITKNQIWGPDSLRAFMEAYPLQLNQHKDQTCSPRQQWEDEYEHVEAFRMSVLFANKACVISAPSAKADMKEWEGLVNFVEFEHTLSKVNELWPKLDECRAKSYAAFKTRYAPQKLLERSGFFESWSPHGR